MKKTIILFITIFITNAGFAQDFIYMRDGTMIQCVVREANNNEIVYTHTENPGGQRHSITTVGVIKIAYANGYTKEYGINSSSSSRSSTQSGNYFALGAGFGRSYGGIGIRAQGRFGGQMGFGVHAGFGYNPANAGGAGFGFGAKYFYYRWLYINAQIGQLGIDYYDYYDSYWGWDYGQEAVWGYSILAGGDFIFGNHVGLNAAIGPTIADGGVRLGFDLGFIFKF